jgi:hypothetical protein
MTKLDYDRKIAEVHHLFRNQLLSLKQESHGCQRLGCKLIVDRMWAELDSLILSDSKDGTR